MRESSSTMRSLAANYFVRLAFALCIATTATSHAQVLPKNDIGFTPLTAELGVNTPTGASVNVVQIEADLLNNGSLQSHPEFAGKTLNYIGPANGNNTGHAIDVARHFYGITTSIAPGISQIELYDANHFLFGGFLHAGAQQNPNFDTQAPYNRVANHSWVGSSTTPRDFLQRLDWVIERDDYVQVVGVDNAVNSSQPLFSEAMNVIAVGTSNGAHEIGTEALGDIYTAGRVRPEIVAPASATSFATPIVSAAAALLIETGHNNPALSQNAFYTSPRTGQTIYHAETSEVIKAALLAGASRMAFNSDGSVIYGYRPAGFQSNNGLDTRHGAGQVNIQNSYHIIAAGKQPSLQDSGPATVNADGFDYDANFGGSSGSNGTAHYELVAGWAGQTLTASLVWNALINIGQTQLGQYDAAASLHNFQLSLIDVTSPTALITLAVSNSPDQNTENIFATLEGGHRYRLEVSRDAAQGAFNGDYGIAWSTTGTIGWTGAASNVWQSGGSVNFIRGQAAAGFRDFEHVVFNDSILDTGIAANSAVQVTGSPSPASILVDNSLVDYSFNSGSIGVTPAALIKRGIGTLALNQANFYTGQTRLEAGKITVSANGALGAAGTASETLITNGAALNLRTVNYSTPETLLLGGNGPSGQGALVSELGSNSFAGPVTLTNSGSIGVPTGSLALSGVVSVPASSTLTKLGAGPLSITGGHTLANGSGISVNEGILNLAPTAASNVSIGASAPLISVSAVGQLNIDAAARDPLSDSAMNTHRVNLVNNANNGLNVIAGLTNAGTISGTGGTSVTGGSTLIIDSISQSSLTIGAGSKLVIRPSGNSLLSTTTIPIGSSGTPAGSGGTVQHSTSSFDFGMTTTAVPEPNAIVLLVIGTVIGLLIANRRSRSRRTLGRVAN